MGILNHIRSRSKPRSSMPEAQIYQQNQYRAHNGRRSTVAGQLPHRVLAAIFAFVCPHSLDDAYTSCEESMIDDGCMLCDMRDLAHCAQVNRAWAGTAQSLLYHSVRLDTVHYCDRELDLSTRRKHKHFFERNAEPKDATKERLKLFLVTVRASTYLASQVQMLKMPYMARESSKADLARSVSVLPNLRYVDLPEGFFSDEASAATLRQELQSRCPDIRKMKYLRGSEGSFIMLAHKRFWQNLETLEISNLTVEADALLYVLASFPALHEVKLGGDMLVLNDDILIPNPNLPAFPPVTRLTFERAPSITAAGLLAFLSRLETREILSSLTLCETGVLPQELHLVLQNAPHLINLSINETVTRPFPISPVPPLASRMLKTLSFEILPQTHSANPPSETYYTYLASSLLSGSLPRLSSLYAYSPSLPDLLLFPPVAPFAAPFAARSGPSSGAGPNSLAQPFSRLSTFAANPPSSFSNRGQRGRSPGPSALAPTTTNLPSLAGLGTALSLYTKPASAPELEWNLTTIDPPSERNGRRGRASATRPLSLVLNERRAASPGAWRPGTAGVMVGNGFGGFLNVPGGVGANGEEPGSPGFKGSVMDGPRKGSRSLGGEWMG